MAEPKLRFLTGENYRHVCAGDIFTERKERGNESLPVLTLSIHSGISDHELDESESVKKVSRSEDKSLYKRVYPGDLAFNMMRAWQGAFGVPTVEGMISPAYIVAAPKEKIIPGWLDIYCRTSRFVGQANNLSYGVTDFRKRLYWDSFEKIQMTIPSLEEQQKIAALFADIEKVIAQSEAEVMSLEKQKKGAMQKIFSQEVRFKRDDGEEYPEWEIHPLSDCFTISSERNKDGKYSVEDVLSVSDEFGVINQIKFHGRSLAGSDISGYKVVKKGQIVYTKSPLALKPFGIIKIVGDETGVISPLYVVNDATNLANPLFMYYYFDSPERTNNYLKPLVRLGAKHTMNISTEEWLSGLVTIPSELEEQKKIADFLSDFDTAINLAKQELESWNLLKKGLMQQMFV